MPPLGRRRHSESSSESPPPRRRRSPADDSEDGDYGGAHATEGNGSDEEQTQGINHEQLVKKMVRLALACEFSRTPIRRPDISTKVLGPNGRKFKQVFDGAQNELRQRFGMEMVELPLKEKITISQRRAQGVDAGRAAQSSNTWVLTSVLPDEYRANLAILSPPKVPTAETESTYIGLYSFIISVISLSGGSLNEAKLERYLRRANADEYTPLDKTEKLLARMIKDGYLYKVKDTAGGEEVVEYMVGPRGKVEVGYDGVAGMVKTVYGEGAPEDLDRRIVRSMGVEEEQRRVKNSKKRQREAEGEDGERMDVDDDEDDTRE